MVGLRLPRASWIGLLLSSSWGRILRCSSDVSGERLKVRPSAVFGLFLRACSSASLFLDIPIFVVRVFYHV